MTSPPESAQSVSSAQDKLHTKCSICGKLWVNHDDWEYTLHAQEEMERGDI